MRTYRAAIRHANRWYGRALIDQQPVGYIRFGKALAHSLTHLRPVDRLRAIEKARQRQIAHAIRERGHCNQRVILQRPSRERARIEAIHQPRLTIARRTELIEYLRVPQPIDFVEQQRIERFVLSRAGYSELHRAHQRAPLQPDITRNARAQTAHHNQRPAIIISKHKKPPPVLKIL